MLTPYKKGAAFVIFRIDNVRNYLFETTIELTNLAVILHYGTVYLAIFRQVKIN